MGWFTKKKQDLTMRANEIRHSEIEEQGEAKTPISKDKFILETKMIDDNLELPIYGIYRRFQEDWETKGYKDSIAFPETSYRENQKRIIVGQLRLAIKEALMRYEDKITDMDNHINHAERNGLVETLDKYRQERKKLVAHREELAILDKDANEIGEKITPILTSYDMGFARGMTSLSDDKVSEIMNNSKYE